MTRSVLLLAVFFIAGFSTTQAQENNTPSLASSHGYDFSNFEVVPEESVTYSNSEVNWSEFELELDDTETDWVFHTDLNNRILYIDFEALGGKMSSLVLQSEVEITLFQDNHLFDLPVNTIYEVNLEDLEIGNYFVILETFHGIVRQEISITE
jgi:hypothetical protein